MFGNMELTKEQTEEMKAKTFKGIYNLIASRCKEYDNGMFKILPDRANPEDGLPVVSFIGVRDGVYYPSGNWETWRDIILAANEAGMSFMERQAQKALLAYISNEEKNKLYEMVDKSGMEANAGMVDATTEGQVIICLSEKKDEVSFYIANVDEDGVPVSFEGKKLDIL